MRSLPLAFFVGCEIDRLERFGSRTRPSVPSSRARFLVAEDLLRSCPAVGWWRSAVVRNAFTPPTDDLHDLYDLFPLDDLDLSGQMHF